MGVVLLQILQWILRIILFLLLFILILVAIILIVPIRYQAEGEFLEKKPGVRGKITWFFYLVSMKFAYEEEFCFVLRVFGFKVLDSGTENEPKKVKKNPVEEEEPVWEGNSVQDENAVREENPVQVEPVREENLKKSDEAENTVHEMEYSLADLEKEIEDAAKEEADTIDKMIQQQVTSSINEEDIANDVQKKSVFDKIEEKKLKLEDIIQKVKDIILKIQEGKLKAEHYLELWNRKETQVTFSRAKRKLGKMIKAILPRTWNVIGEIGFSDPATTGQLMAVFGAMYPVIGSHVQIVPDFEEEVMNIRGNIKGHIRLGNLLYQLISLILNIHCFKFIKLILDELSGSKKSNKQNNSKKNKKET